MPLAASSLDTTPDIGMTLEMSHSSNARVRLKVLDSCSSKAITAAVNNHVEQNATLLIKSHEWLTQDCLIPTDHLGQPTKEQLERGNILLKETVYWLNTVYRRAIARCHLQGYLDEFCFRHNTASWPDRLTTLDHLLTGLLSPVGKSSSTEPAAGTGGKS